MTPTVISSIMGVFTEIGTWISSTITSMSDLFYNDGLTFIGTLAIASVGVGLVMLLFNKVRNFLAFR